MRSRLPIQACRCEKAVEKAKGKTPIAMRLASVLLAVLCLGKPASAQTLTATVNGSAVTTVAFGTTVSLTAAGAGSGKVNFCEAPSSACSGVYLLGSATITGSGTTASAAIQFVPGPGCHSYYAETVSSTPVLFSPASLMVTLTSTGAKPATTTTIASSGSAGSYTLTGQVTGYVSTAALASPAPAPEGAVSFLDASNGSALLGTAELGAGMAAQSWTSCVSAALTQPAFSAPEAIATGDFNGDGKTDLAVGESFAPSGPLVQIFLGNGDGTFTQGGSISTGPLPVAIGVGSFGGVNGDLVVSNGGLGAPKVTFFLNDGKGNFTAGQSVSLANSPGGIVVGPNSSYLAVANGSSAVEAGATAPADGQVSILTPTNGKFAVTANVPVGREPGGVVATASGLAVANSFDGTVTVLTGSASAGFSASQTVAIGNSVGGIAVGDFRGNGAEDLVVSNSDDSVLVLVPSGGGFAVSQTLTVGLVPIGVTTGDFNGDGKTDIAIANLEGNTVSVLFGNGDGTFQPAVTLSTGAGPTYLSAGNFSGHGNVDLAVTNETDDDLSILLSHITQSATGTASGIAVPGSGTHKVSASFSGDGNYGSSVSATTGLTAQPLPTSLALMANPTSATAGQQVLLTAMLTPNSADGDSTQGETITFYNGTVSLGSGTLSGGLATLNTSSLPVGSNSLTARFLADANFSTSVSAPVTVKVNAAAPAVSLAPATLTFASTHVGVTTAAQVVTVENTGTAALMLTSEAITGTNATSFLQSATTCGTSLAIGATCTVSVEFKPLAAESLTASLSIADNATGSPQQIALSGTGTSVFTPTGLQFVPVTPCRIADTRNPAGAFGGPEMTAGATRTFAIPQSACGIPSTAVAYSLNVTVVPTGSLSYLTLWPAGETQPVVSTLNSDGRVKANAAITPAGTSGAVSVFVSDATHVILDIDGYFAPAGTASALAFYPLTPCRVVDTRGVSGPLGGPSLAAGAVRGFPVQSSACNIPSNAQAYSLNVTAVPHKTLNYLTSWPTGEAQPNVSTLNSSTGAVTANAAIVPSGTGGNVSIFVSDDADVILDINGYFAPVTTGGLSLYTVTPCRVIDTRSGAGAFSSVLAVNVESSTCAPSSTAQAYVLNATVVPSGPLNYLTLWPNGESQPNVSTLNADDGAITSNMAIVPTNNGRVDAFSSNPTNLILDISSYFAP